MATLHFPKISKFWKCFSVLGNWSANQKLTASFVQGYLEPDQNQLWFPDPELEPKLEFNFFSRSRPKSDSGFHFLWNPKSSKFFKEPKTSKHFIIHVSVFPLVAISNYNMKHRRIVSVETNVVEFFIFQRTSDPCFHIKFFFVGSLSPALSLVLQISKLVVLILTLF